MQTNAFSERRLLEAKVLIKIIRSLDSTFLQFLPMTLADLHILGAGRAMCIHKASTVDCNHDWMVTVATLIIGPELINSIFGGQIKRTLKKLLNSPVKFSVH